MSTKSKVELITEYKEQLRIIKKLTKEINISEEETNKLFKECLKILKKDNVFKISSIKTAFIYFIKLIIYLCILVIILRILISYQLLFSFIMRNIQGLIYPGLKLLRLFSMPIIAIFPSLSNLYDESCLIPNPYFHVPNMDCWPCENIQTVVNFTGVHNWTVYQSGVPYTIKSNQSIVNLELLKNVYKNNKNIFDKDASPLYYSNRKKYKNICDIMNLNTTEKDLYLIWRINRMNPTREIRKIFPSPKDISMPYWTGQSTERFVLIAGLNAKRIAFPDTECSYAFMIQGNGEQSVVLKPALECSATCRSVSVVLKQSDVLFYNWWYWKPISIPLKNSSTPLITYVSSFC